MDIPNLKPGDWIQTHNGLLPMNFVVCQVYNDPLQKEVSGDIEVVYLDQLGRAINEYMNWDGVSWKLKDDQPCGGYADSNPRLTDYVRILKQGRKHII